MFDQYLFLKSLYSKAGFERRLLNIFAVSWRGFWTVCAVAFVLWLPVHGQQDDSKDSPVIVQPGAPGQKTLVLPKTTQATLPPVTKKDVEFMQGMMHHHAQAVEMTALIEERTKNDEVRLIGARISQSQADEINFMKRWLTSRGEETSMTMGNMDMSDMSGHQHHQMLMPGMLTAKQMDALRKADGKEFDRLFLSGMIQHHTGALVMVEDLFKSKAAGQDAELFNFATDVDSTQRAEIRLMEGISGEKP